MPFAANPRALVERLDECLPQTQCTRCGYPRCRAYAEAIARGEADINRCPPGGDVTLRGLARVCGVPSKPLDPNYGRHEPRRRALIEESRCIGCRKCLDVCPVDAIVGAHQWLHSVIAVQCTGCELCLAPCPVDCIAMIPVPAASEQAAPWSEYARAEVDAWRVKAENRLARLARPRDKRASRRGAARARDELAHETPSREQMRTEIQAAIERVKRKRAAASSRTSRK
jgi:electron transport complex protein RnfB